MSKSYDHFIVGKLYRYTKLQPITVYEDVSGWTPLVFMLDHDDVFMVVEASKHIGINKLKIALPKGVGWVPMNLSWAKRIK